MQLQNDRDTGCLLELKQVSRRISSEFYLRGVSLGVHAGAVHALVGKNASGKSTLFSVIIGEFPADSGEILLYGNPIKIRDSKTAADNGLMLISQNQKMFPNLTVYENMFFGRELMIAKNVKMISNRKMIVAAGEVFTQMGVKIDPTMAARELSPAQRQLTAIARAIVSDARVLLLDEPSTHLNPQEKQILYDAIHLLKAKGKAFLIISHDLDEVLSTADEVSVMENGELLRTAPTASFDRNSLIEATYGIKVENLYRREPVELGDEVLRAENIQVEQYPPVSFTLRRGQLLAFTGGAHSGKLELARALAGLCKATGSLWLNGVALPLNSPISAVRSGLVLASSAADEETIRESEQMVDAGKGDTKGSRALVALHIFASDLGKTFAPYVGMRPREEYMTGGNRQRELVERTMRKQASVYVLCEPSAGVDVPTRMRIYYEINRLLKNGAGVLLVTSDAEEAHRLADDCVTLGETGITGITGSTGEGAL